MAEQKVTRKLTTILAADVEGYSRLMRADEEATFKTLGEYRETFDDLITRHEGRVFSTGGDSVLAEFGSAVEAVRCAIAFQEAISSRNTELADDRKMIFRIGINVGDVMIRDGDLFGDGVNVAARLEGLAKAGGVCISGSVFEQIKHKLSLDFEDIGPQQLKNIAERVSAYRLVPDSVSVATTGTAAKPSAARSWRMRAIAAAAVVVIGAGGLAVWRSWEPDFEPVRAKDMAFPLSERPSIAVLPFENLSGDSQQDYFSDGMTDTIIAALSEVSNMFVIARNSVFTYKGKPMKVQQVAEELGVRYVLEGSFQRSDDRVRITARLVDALTGHQMWAERYDRELEDIFALQDDIARNVVTALEVNLTEGEQARVWRRQTENAEAYEHFLRGREFEQRFSKADNAEARRWFEKAVAMDPGFARAWIDLARTHYLDVRFGWSENSARSLSRATELAEKALALDDTHADVHAMLGNLALIGRQPDQALAHCDKALSLNPQAEALALCGLHRTYLGAPEEGLELVKRAMRQSPYYPGWYLFALGNAHRLMGQYDEAIAALEKLSERLPPHSPVPHTVLAFTYMEVGREEDARAAVVEVLKRDPTFTRKKYEKTLAYKDPVETERVLDSLRKAGLPE